MSKALKLFVLKSKFNLQLLVLTEVCKSYDSWGNNAVHAMTLFKASADPKTDFALKFVNL